MSGTVVCVAERAEQLDAVRELFRAYGAYLAGKADICIANLDGEIASLPGRYFLVLLAAIDDSPAGCVALRSLTRPGEQACELKRLWVSPAFRGHRLGRRLMEAAAAYAAQAGYSALYLDTVPAAMPEANRMYEAMGFQHVDRYNANPVANVVFFRLDLTNGAVPSADGTLSGTENPGRFGNPPQP